MEEINILRGREREQGIKKDIGSDIYKDREMEIEGEMKEEI